jgi:hypothetical protein
MDYLLISSCLAAFVLFAFVRPRWRQMGPSLLDSFVIGLLLFATGSIFVWIEGPDNSETVMRIGLSTALSGMLGASLWSVVFGSKIAPLNFFDDARHLVADPADRFVISTGLVISSLVSVALLVAVFSHEHIRSLLLGAFQTPKNLADVRIIISSGLEGYFAPGYVKQFRDIIVPILCSAAIFCGGAYRHRGLLFVALLIALAAIFISGQRLVIIQYVLCLGAAVLINRSFPRKSFASVLASLALLLVLLGAVGGMTKLLGRLDGPLSPLSDQQILKLHEFVGDLATKRETVSQRISVAVEKVKAAETAGSQAQLNSAKKELDDAEAEATLLKQATARVERGQLPPSATGFLDSPDTPGFIRVPLALVHRALIAVPRENTLSYRLWADKPHAAGSGWFTDLGGIRPGTQSQLSNDLSGETSNTGNSPLGLATDVFYNWGWLGVMIVPALFALAFLWLDIALVASRSVLTSAAKVFMFFSIPTMYSPFMFILYGGFVAIGILCYVWLRQKGAFSFVGIRPQAR